MSFKIPLLAQDTSDPPPLSPSCRVSILSRIACPVRNPALPSGFLCVSDSVVAHGPDIRDRVSGDTPLTESRAEASAV